LQTRIGRDGDHLVINGRKWFITGAAHPNCRLAVLIGVDDAAGLRRAPEGARRRHRPALARVIDGSRFPRIVSPLDQSV
jgi:acyl-CoA dehydrogenase